jgi:hypothetical protein
MACRHTLAPSEESVADDVVHLIGPAAKNHPGTGLGGKHHFTKDSIVVHLFQVSLSNPLDRCCFGSRIGLNRESGVIGLALPYSPVAKTCNQTLNVIPWNSANQRRLELMNKVCSKVALPAASR